MKYNLRWDAKNKCITILNGKDKGDHIASQLVYGEVGDMPDASSHPQPYQHLKNVAMQQGVADYDLVTVVNESDNTLLDKFAKTADEAKQKRLNEDEIRKQLFANGKGIQDEHPNDEPYKERKEPTEHVGGEEALVDAVSDQKASFAKTDAKHKDAKTEEKKDAKKAA